jgi:ubiquinone/menaquinone biosynthesis C-methylase UbiE
MTDFLIEGNHKRYQQRLDEYLLMGYDMSGSREKIVQRLDHLPQESRILDVGTGKGHLALAIAQSGKSCTSIDISTEEQYIARLNALYFHVDEKIDFQQQDITALGFQDESFDAVLSVTALHHIKDTQPALEEILRVTKKGGLIILADFNERGRQTVNRMHQKEGREHKCVGWDLRAIRSWFAKQNQMADYNEEECLWVLVVKKK